MDLTSTATAVDFQSNIISENASVSVVVPFLDEIETLEKLYDRIYAVLAPMDRDWELIFVDDGSTDGGTDVAAALAKSKEHVRLVRFTRNFGKASALSAGIAQAQGDIIVTMDADLQDDPKEIPRFLERISENYDVVSGWKQTRHDPLGKTLPSRVFNRMTAKMFDIDIHDINCGFKAYTRRAAKRLNLYGELHRFTPALLHAVGFNCTEIVVEHHAREHGQSKYGMMRMVKGFLDLSTVKLLTRYQSRPLHFFAMIGLPLLLIGLSFIAYLSVLWLLGMGPIGTRPLLFIGILFTVTGTQILGVGLVAELLQASGLRERDKYVIDEVIES
ncbi:glycosyltransferase family 2 protein [Aliiroseovarius sp. F20344]|uniref:glycosyltransferase family 2 protein n=1 Tax=Aliiroseovarius sp. F20344 TaxID=2926414 RepID=UPI001FF3F1E8|nr:glycosyltransferase family 2 protein [Aliiroseovarius sp. F20344]MCK0141234.1 glycosyltransferase family 2 protein [Aliiroseovarius sp. F20344]